MLDYIRSAAHVVPNPNQLAMLRETPFYMFVHFSPNTYTGKEWGDGTENPAIFNPEKLDCEQWARAALSAGMKGIVLTAKHHDGFCLWQSDYTEHCMKNSPYKNGKGDVVAECAAACKKYGLKFGFYLSPWDRNSKLYGTDAYNTYYKNQLTELLTNYGEIFYVWFDGACGEGPNGKKQVYDFEGYFQLIARYQPNAAVFNDRGIIRWCGNEAGVAPYAQWAVVPRELCPYCRVQTKKGPLAGSLDFMYNTDEGIGSLPNILYSEGLVFAPAEVDMSIRNGWFYHPEEEPHGLERLMKTYLSSVGNNSTFNLNVPPTPSGLMDERDIKRLAEFGALLQTTFCKNLAADATVFETFPRGETQPEYIIRLPEVRTVNYVELAERIAEGQRIESFIIYIRDENGLWQKRGEGTTVGSRKIVPIKAVETNGVKITVTAARDKVDMESLKLW